MGINYSDVIVADNVIIQNYIKTEYSKFAELIEYGGDNAKWVEMKLETSLNYKIKPREYAFKVCRIEPENNIDLILEAFKNSEIKLLLIGNWNFSNYGIKLEKKV